MKAHLMIFFLFISMGMTTAAVERASIKRDGLPIAAGEERRLTSEEEQKARLLITHFKERWRTTNDFGQIVDEMYVNDFSERLRQSRIDWLPWAFLHKSLIAQADDGQLRRYYVASMNFYGLFFRLSEAASLRKQSGDEEEPKIEDVLSLEIINVLRGDPTLAELAEEFKEDEENERAKEDDHNQPAKSGDSPQAAGATAQADDNKRTEQSENGIIKSLSQLKGIVTTLEHAAELMRQRLANMSLITPSLSGDANAQSRRESLEFHPTTLDEGDYGYPEGTKIIQAKALPYCLRLIGINGQLKILSVDIYVD